MKHIGLATVAVLAFGSQAAASDVHLVCNGSATYVEEEGGGGGAWSAAGSGPNGSWSGGSAGTAPIVRTGHTPAQIVVELSDNGTGRMRFPEVLSGSGLMKRDAWRPLKNVQMTDTEITGTYPGWAMYFLPTTRNFTIDRVTGHIEMFRFSGECQPYDPSPEARKF
jgi:hypothetical protein